MDVVWIYLYLQVELKCHLCPTDAAMAAAFPYRGVPGGMPPGVPPPAPVADYMSEEKLQEKGKNKHLFWGVYIYIKNCVSFKYTAYTGVFVFYSSEMATTAGKALLGEEEVWFCGCSEGGHAS